MSEEQQGYELPEPNPYDPHVPYVSPPQHRPLPPSMHAGERYFPFPEPPVLPPSQPPPIVPGAPSARKKNRRGLWISMSIMAALLLLLASVASFFIFRYVNRSTPTRALDAFCTALQREDYHSAYDQFSKKLQSTFSEARFATILSQDKVTACTHGTPDDSGTSTTTNLKLVHASKGTNNDAVTLTKDSNNDWKIDDVRLQT